MKKRMTKAEQKALLDSIDAWAEDQDCEVLMLGKSEERIDFMPAVLGTTLRPYPAVVYSGTAIVECFMRINKWTYEEAIEWYDYNVLRGLDYEKTPFIIVEDVLDG